MSSPPDPSQSPTQALGCGLLVMGVAGGAFGLVALLGISDHVEFEFFGVEFNDTRGQAIWVAASLAAVVGGLLILRALRRAG